MNIIFLNLHNPPFTAKTNIRFQLENVDCSSQRTADGRQLIGLPMYIEGRLKTSDGPFQSQMKINV